MAVLPSRGNLHGRIIRTHYRRQFQYQTYMARKETRHRAQHSDGRARKGNQARIQGRKLFAQFHAHLVQPVLGLVQPGLHGVVLHVELFDDACAVLVSAIRLFLPCPDVVHLARHDGKHGSHALPFRLQVAENGGKVGQSAFLGQPLHEAKQSLVGIGLQNVAERLYVHAGNLGEFGRIGKHLQHDVLECRRTRLVAQHVLVHYRSKAQYVGLRDMRLMSRTGYPCREIHKESFCRTGVLRHLVHRRTGGQHGRTKPHPLVFPEHHGQFADIFDSIFTQIFTQSHVDFVCRIHEFQYALLGGDTQPSGLSRQPVQFRTGCARIRFLQFIVQAAHLLFRHARVFHHLTFGLFHFCKVLHIAAHQVFHFGHPGPYVLESEREVHPTGFHPVPRLCPHGKVLRLEGRLAQLRVVLSQHAFEFTDSFHIISVLLALKISLV